MLTVAIPCFLCPFPAHPQDAKRKIVECMGPNAEQRLAKKKRVGKEKSPFGKENSPNRKVIAVKSPKKSPMKNNSNIEFKINSYKVVELRDELKRLGLSTAGKKVQLRNRLIKAMLEKNSSAEQKVAEKQEEKPPAQAHAEELPEEPVPEVEMVDASEQQATTEPVEANVESSKSNMVDVSPKADKMEIEEEAPASAKDMSDQGPVVVPVAHIVKKLSPKKMPLQSQAIPKSNFSKSPMEAEKRAGTASFAPSPLKKSQEAVKPNGQAQKFSRSPLRGFVKSAMKSFNSPAPVSHKISKTSSTDSEEVSSKASSDVVSDTSVGSREPSEKIKGLMANFSKSAMNNTMPAPSAVLSQSSKAKLDARKAKAQLLANKTHGHSSSKPNTTPGGPFKPTLPSLKPTSASSSTKKTLLQQKMREKAFKKEELSGLKSTADHRNPFATPREVAKSALSSSSSLKKKVVQPQIPAKVRSPLDTYEISDREDSETDDSDSDSEDRKKPKKKVCSYFQLRSYIFHCPPHILSNIFLCFSLSIDSRMGTTTELTRST